MKHEQQPSEKEKLTGTLALVASTLIWGSSFVVVKDAVEGVPPFLLMGTRLFIAAVTVGVLCRRQLRHMGGKLILRGSVLGAVYAAAMVLQTWGIKLSTPGKSAFLIASYCVMMPFMEWVAFKKAPKGRSIFAAAIGLTGIGLVALNERLVMQPGDMLSIAGSFLFGLQILLMAVYMKKHRMTQLTFIMLLSGGLTLLIISPFAETLPRIDLRAAGIMLYLGAICSGLPILGQGYAQQRLAPTAVTVILGFEAVFAAVFSAIFHHEAFTLRCLTGFAMIFAAVIICELPERNGEDS